MLVARHRAVFNLRPYQGHSACDGCGRDLLTSEDFLEYFVSDVTEELQTQIEGIDYCAAYFLTLFSNLFSVKAMFLVLFG